MGQGIIYNLCRAFRYTGGPFSEISDVDVAGFPDGCPTPNLRQLQLQTSDELGVYTQCRQGPRLTASIILLANCPIMHQTAIVFESYI